MLSHWLSDKALFFRYISAIPPGWLGGYLLHCNTHFSLLSITTILKHYHACIISYSPSNLLIFLYSLPLINPPPPHIHLHCLHLIYTYTAYISFIPPHTPTQPTSHLSPHIYLFNPHLIYPPTFSYTACISFIPHIYLHYLHLIYPPTCSYTACISFIPHIYLHCLHLMYPPDIPTQPVSHLSPHMYLKLPAPHLSPDIYLHCLHLIYLMIQHLNHHHDSKLSSLQDI